MPMLVHDLLQLQTQALSRPVQPAASPTASGRGLKRVIAGASIGLGGAMLGSAGLVAGVSAIAWPAGALGAVGVLLLVSGVSRNA